MTYAPLRQVSLQLSVLHACSSLEPLGPLNRQSLRTRTSVHAPAVKGAMSHFKCYFKKPKDIFISVKTKTKMQMDCILKKMRLTLSSVSLLFWKNR